MFDIEISQERLAELLEKEDILDALYCAGVDNWGGYDLAMEMIDRGEED